jgi:hypothetical protein
LYDPEPARKFDAGHPLLGLREVIYGLEVPNQLRAGDRGDGEPDVKELDRLTLARELLLRKCQGRRGNLELPRLVDLCLNSPIVSVPFAAKALGGVSQQAATIMIHELS